ncbi:SIS domain-containing protein [Lactiplantibacillus pentosus]|uniref:SIS domain-containing protein n=1 Tax=Lactiplantibacillus pentosus TaxID=1589 RepID=UPI003857C747
MQNEVQTTSLVEVQQMVQSITKQHGISTLAFVGCGASMSELYPAKYFLEQEAHSLRTALLTANEFNYARPNFADESAVVVVASLGGTTQESIEATKNAHDWGCTVVAVTHNPDAKLTEAADYVLVHSFFTSYATKAAKTKVVLEFSAEMLNAVEGYDNYEAIQTAFAGIDDVINEGVKSVTPAAKEFAQEYKDDQLIYTISSGATFGTAYSTANFLFMEMQWIASPVIHSGEYFHGPFEMTNNGTPYLLFMNDGKTRHLDARVLEFLQRFEARFTVIDAKDYGLDSVCAPTVIDYFNPLIITGVMRVYAEELAKARNHPLTKRQYMWKLENY